MTVASRHSASASTAYELRSAALTLISLVVKTPDLVQLAAELAQQRADGPGLFDGDPVVIDVSALRESGADIDYAALVALLREHRMVPVAVKGAPAEHAQAAHDAGLAEAPEGAPPAPRKKAELPAEPPPPPPATTTLVIDRPLRSGQQVYARGGDLVVMAVVNFGAEVLADGNIHVYAPLRGRAIAGARGNTAARIFSTCMEPQLLSIAGTYLTCETDLPGDVQGKPAQVRLEGDRLVIEPIAS